MFHDGAEDVPTRTSGPEIAEIAWQRRAQRGEKKAASCHESDLVENAECDSYGNYVITCYHQTKVEGALVERALERRGLLRFTLRSFVTSCMMRHHQAPSSHTASSYAQTKSTTDTSGTNRLLKRWNMDTWESYNQDMTSRFYRFESRLVRSRSAMTARRTSAYAISQNHSTYPTRT